MKPTTSCIGSCSSTQSSSSSCSSFNNLVGALRARVAPFGFLANMSLLLVLARAIGATLHLLPSIENLARSLHDALTPSQCPAPLLPELFLVMILITLAALHFRAGHSSVPPEYGPIRDYAERCFDVQSVAGTDGQFSDSLQQLSSDTAPSDPDIDNPFSYSLQQLSSVPAPSDPGVDDPFSDDEVFFDAVADESADAGVQKKAVAAPKATSLRIQLAIPEACDEVMCAEERGRQEDPRPSAPLWPDLPMSPTLKVQTSVQEEEDDLWSQVMSKGSGFIYYYSPSGEKTIYPSSPSRLDRLSPRQVNDEFQQFRSRGWARIRGKRHVKPCAVVPNTHR